MGYILATNDGPKEAGQYAVFTLFENQLMTRPFSLVQRDFQLKKFFRDHPNTGGKNNDGRVMDCLCRIDAVLKDKRDHEFGLLTPIMSTKQTYDLNLDSPNIFMKRVEKWAVDHKRSLKIGKLKWENNYKDPKEALTKTYECIDVLLNKSQMKFDELLDASNVVLADKTSKVSLRDPEGLVEHVYDLRHSTNEMFNIVYEQTGETCRISIGALAKLYKEGRLTNAELTIQGSLVAIKQTCNK